MASILYDDTIVGEPFSSEINPLQSMRVSLPITSAEPQRSHLKDLRTSVKRFYLIVVGHLTYLMMFVRKIWTFVVCRCVMFFIAAKALGNNPNNNLLYLIYQSWIFFLAFCSTVFTPFEAAFLGGLHGYFHIPDLIAQGMFFFDAIIVEPFKEGSILCRLVICSLCVIACFPWDLIFKAFGLPVQILLLSRLVRLLHIHRFSNWLDKNIHHDMWNKVQAIFKILIVPFYIVHVLGCFMFYLATTYHPWGDTWIGSLKMGTYSYSDLKEIDLPRKYVTSLYWSAMTFTTIGFGDIHAVNIREMLAMTIFSLLGVFLQAYITNSMTMLFVIKRTEQQTSASEGAPPHWDDKLHQLTKTMQKLEETIGGLVEKLDQQVELRGSMDNREIQEQREQGDRGSNRHRQQFEINPVD